MSVLGFLCHGRPLFGWVLSGFLAFASLSAAATSWTLLDSTSGMILAAENDDEAVDPGDFAKLMTIYTQPQRRYAVNSEFIFPPDNRLNSAFCCGPSPSQAPTMPALRSRMPLPLREPTLSPT